MTLEPLARTEPIFGAEQAQARSVAIIGCGSVGSVAANQLARTGIGHLTIVDPDVVEPANLSRTEYTTEDVGSPKVDALAERIRSLTGTTTVTTHQRSLALVDCEQFAAELAGHDLIIAATDDPEAQAIADWAAHENGIPMVAIGLYAGAKGGEIFAVVPGKTPCYACVMGIRTGLDEELQRTRDYGTGRLEAQPALGCDIATVTSIGVRISLSLLAPEGSELAGVAAEIVESGETFLTIGLVSDFWFFPKVFGNTVGQRSHQTVWVQTSRRDSCERCNQPIPLEQEIIE